MEKLAISIGEPFSSPTWGSNVAIFSSKSGRAIAEKDSKSYLNKACNYAKKYEVFLVPEKFMLQQSQCMCLIDPSGKVIGAQKAIFNNPNLHIKEKGIDIDVIKTPIGGIFLCVDVDIYRPEVPKIAFNMGAKIIICSQQFGLNQYTSHSVVAGVWSAAQDNGVITVGVSNSYNAICAPKAVTKHNDGFISSPSTRLPVSTKIDVEEILGDLKIKPALKRKIYVVHKQELLGETEKK